MGAKRLFAALVERIRNIVMAPRAEWPVIATESTSVRRLYSGYVAPMAAFAAAMSFIRMSIVGVTPPWGGTIRTSVPSALVACAAGTLASFGSGLLRQDSMTRPV